MASTTVTLDKVYFETLLRRAQFHTSGVDYSTPVDVPTVTIPKPDHDNLLNIAREYANLRRNLYKGGVTDETLAILINDDQPHALGSLDGMTNFNTTHTSDVGAIQSQVPRSSTQGLSHSRPGGQNYTYGRNDNLRRGSNAANGLSNGHVFEEFSIVPDMPVDGFSDTGNGYADYSRRPQYMKHAKRTIQLTNLPDGATYAEITDVVRGGILLDIYIRSNDRIAAISFLEEEPAQAFFHHVRRNDLYIRGRRVDIRWSDRHFILLGHVANKIAIGATRNLVIRNASPRHTEEVIRNDLEHIHNLVVIAVAFEGQNVHISTNSVHNAMFARTCMMSRTTYKGSKIDWDADECASPIPKSPPQSRKENTPAKKQAVPLNRFELLDMDSTDDSTAGSETDIGVSLKSPISFPPTKTGIAV